MFRARREQRLTLRALSAKAGLSAALLSMIEQDDHTPPKQTIEAIARALSADVDLWCGLAGTVSSESERTFAKLAAEDPLYFRRLRSKVDQRR